MKSEEYLRIHSLDKKFITKVFGVEIDDQTISIPIKNKKGEVLGIKKRNINYKERGIEKFNNPTSLSSLLFNSDLVKNESDIVFCEGELDCMRLMQAGISAVTSTTGVGSIPKDLSILKNKNVYVCLDTDKAGHNNTKKVAEKINAVATAVKIIELPKETKDVCEYFAGRGTKDSFLNLMDQAITLPEWETNDVKDEWRLESGVELMNREIPPEEWLIDRILPTDGFTFIVGAEATGKSFYTLTMAYSIVTGNPWLGQFKIGKRTNVLFIDKENSPRRKKARIEGLGLKDGLEHIYWIKYPQYFELDDDKENDGLSQFAKELGKQVIKLEIGLIIIDSFADVMVGNENAAGEVQEFFSALRKIFPNKSILVLHHENKPSQGVSRTTSQRVRGSTNITAQIVSGFRVFSIPKTINEFVLEQFKAGDAEKLKPFKVELVSTVHPCDSTKTIVSEIKYDGEYYDQEKQSDLAEKLIGELFVESSINTRQKILCHCFDNGVSNPTTSRMLSKLTRDEVLEKKKDGRAMNYIWIKK